VGTIVGSAVFNILVIIACAGTFAKSALDIDHLPFARDVMFYLSSIIILFLTIQPFGTAAGPTHSVQQGAPQAAQVTTASGYAIWEWKDEDGNLWSDQDGFTVPVLDADNEFTFEANHDSAANTKAAVCCAPGSMLADGVSCSQISGNMFRMKPDVKTLVNGETYVDTEGEKHDGILRVSTAEEAAAFAVEADATTNDVCATIDEQLYCCDPILAAQLFPIVAESVTVDAETYNVAKLVPERTSDGFLTCPIKPIVFECACNSSDDPTNAVWPTYAHGRPSCDGSFGTEGQITMGEALAMIPCYGLYILFMVFNERILNKCRSKKKEFKTAKQKKDEYDEQLKKEEEKNNEILELESAVTDPEKGSEADERETNPDDGQATQGDEPERKDNETKDDKKAEDDDDDDENKNGCVKCIEKTLDILTFPWQVAFKLTIPDCNFEEEGKPWICCGRETAGEEDLQEGLDERRENGELTKEQAEEEFQKEKAYRTQWYMLTFVMSIGWIAGISVVMVLIANWLSCLIGIPPIIMAVTVLAAGTSIPDALGSVIAARAGLGDMAVSNALGSNVFDIFLCLGFPYFLYDVINWGNWYCVDTTGIMIHMFILFGTVISTVLIFIITRWKLNKLLGVLMLVLYAGFLVYSIIAGIDQQNQVDTCQNYKNDDGSLLGVAGLGSSHFVRNPADSRIGDIYANNVFNNPGSDSVPATPQYNYQFDGLEGYTNTCRDVCSNRFSG